jgi:hypothetical protein
VKRRLQRSIQWQYALLFPFHPVPRCSLAVGSWARAVSCLMVA